MEAQHILQVLFCCIKVLPRGLVVPATYAYAHILIFINGSFNKLPTFTVLLPVLHTVCMCFLPPAIPKRHLARSLIREKAQLARAASYAVTNKDVDESPSATESSDLIGPEAGVGSHDLSLDSSSVSVCVEKENAEEQGTCMY